MSEWQPIETAPKDGTAFVAVSTWNRYAKAVLTYDRNIGGWWDWRETEVMEDLGRMFSHWMPLPAPPDPRATAPANPADQSSPGP
jgi:hypothetical protein